MTPKLEVSGLGYSYHTMEGETPALSDISFSIEAGEFLAVVGPSGCGKSTLLSLLSGLLKAETGEIRIDGRPLSESRSDIGYMLQRDHLFEWRSILSNVSLGLEIQRKKDAAHIGRVHELLDLYGLKGFKSSRPSELSGGMRQRAALIRTLALDPDILMLDEPFSALDSYLKWNLELELSDLLAGFRGPILWVSHDRDECYRNCRSVCVMEDGRTGEVTPMDEMIRHPGSVSAARLAGCKNFFAAEARDGKVYLPEWNVALPLAGMENTFTTIGIPDNAVTMSENGAMSCTVCRRILGVEENILLLRPEGSAEGAPMLRITVGHESDLQAGAAVRVALDYSKLLLL